MKKAFLILMIIPSICLSQANNPKCVTNLDKAFENYDDKNYNDAITLATECLLENPDNIKALTILSFSYFELEEYKMSLLMSNKWFLTALENGTKEQQSLSTFFKGLNQYHLGEGDHCNSWIAAVLVGGSYLTGTLESMSPKYLPLILDECYSD